MDGLRDTCCPQNFVLRTRCLLPALPPLGKPLKLHRLLPHPSQNHPLTGRRISLMEASKHGPCVPGRKAFCTFTLTESGKTSSGRSHPNRLRGAAFACHRLQGNKPNTGVYSLGQAIRVNLPPRSPGLHQPSPAIS